MGKKAHALGRRRLLAGIGSQGGNARTAGDSGVGCGERLGGAVLGAVVAA